ncbi:MAG TPA: undecaprenyl-diphosphate phosphatase [Armatimonadota bacterium]|nr:undecaprenyl-diphosphate phosphatase [Armatimonadota bacterium]
MQRKTVIISCLFTLVLLVTACTVVWGMSPTANAIPVALDSMKATILGLVEGLTEYLPVSSTGHLYLAQHLMGLGKTLQEKDAADAYAICIQAGAILAVLGLYRSRFRQMTLGIVGRDATGRRLLINTIMAFIPAAIIGVIGEKYIKDYLFGIRPITAAWLIGGIAILLIARQRRQIAPQDGIGVEEITPKQAFLIGCSQCLAMWPGVSRSLATIVGGTIVGLSVVSAVEFSFILGLVTLGAATVFEGLKEGPIIISHFGIVTPLIGLAVAWLAAVISVKWMVGYLNRHGLAIFGYYRIVLAIVVSVLIITGFMR